MTTQIRPGKYTAMTVTKDGMVIQPAASKRAALKLAATMPGLVRVATPSGNLVKYVDNRK